MAADIANVNHSGVHPDPTPLAVQGFSYADRAVVLSALASSISLSGGWVLQKRNLSLNSIELQLEIQIRGVGDLYAAMLSTGLELTRSGHLTLAERCICRHHLTSISAQSRILVIRLAISFLDENDLSTPLRAFAGNA